MRIRNGRVHIKNVDDIEIDLRKSKLALVYQWPSEFGRFSFLEKKFFSCVCKKLQITFEKTIISISIFYIYTRVFFIFIVRRYIFLYNNLISRENRCVSSVEIFNREFLILTIQGWILDDRDVNEKIFFNSDSLKFF